MNVGETHRLVVHPQGKKLLAISDKRIVWVELPDDLSRKELGNAASAPESVPPVVK